MILPNSTIYSAIRRIAIIVAAIFMATSPTLAQPGTTYKPSNKNKANGPTSNNKERLRKEGEALFGENTSQKPGEVSSKWSIILAAYRDEAQHEQAQFGLERTRNVAGLKDAYLEKRGAATVIAFGRYDTEPAGQKDLERIRAMEVVIDGQKDKPFTNSFLAPPAEIKGSVPEYDLRNARKAKPWAMYTLQMGIYGREDKPATASELAEFRKAAEQAAIQLRREGEEAYYYHGASRSMVTIGIFAAEDFDAQSGYESPQIKELRKRFPYNLLNGAGIKRKIRITDPRTGKQIKTDRIDPSGLVLVPRE